MPQAKKQRTRYLEANGVGREVIVTDTVLRGIFGLSNRAKPPRSLRRFALVANLYSNLADVYQSLSYIADWREAFCGSPKLDVEVCNINNLLHFGACLFRIRR